MRAGTLDDVDDLPESVAEARPSGETLITVSPARPVGWVITNNRMPLERHSFIDKRLALSFAERWASVNRPSRLALLDATATAVREWRFASSSEQEGRG